MPHNVKLVNNPYMQRLSILIDGKSLSPYSSLYQHMNSPFYEWCDCILDDIGKHFNGESFSLEFSSSDEEMNVMQVLASSHDLCTNYISLPLIRATSTSKRLRFLNSLIRDKQISDYAFQNLDALFVLSEELSSLENDIMSLDVKNSFCKLQPQIVSMKNFSQVSNKPRETIFILTKRQLSADKLKLFSNEEGFLIQISDSFSQEIVFREKIGRLFVYQTRRNFLDEAIFKCLLFVPLVQTLRKCVASFAPEIKNRYKEFFEEIQSTTNKIIPIAESNTIEQGRSVMIKFDSDIEELPVDIEDLCFTYSREGIIRCNGLLVEGLRSGSCNMYIHRKGEKNPSAEVSFKVIKRNRVQKIMFEYKSIELAEGSTYAVRFSVMPSDADNIDSITWITTNPQIASVEKAVLQAYKAGSCDIRCVVENVSSSFRCIVRPVLVAIIPEEDTLRIACGDSRDLNIRIMPENAIDGRLLVTSMDMRVANVVGQTVHGVGKGRTIIVIENESHTLRKEIPVEVFKNSFLGAFFSEMKRVVLNGKSSRN